MPSNINDLLCCWQSLDLIYDSYTEFNVIGDASVHLTGYYMKGAALLPPFDHKHPHSPLPCPLMSAH